MVLGDVDGSTWIDTVESANSWRNELRPAACTATEIKTFCILAKRTPWKQCKVLVEEIVKFTLVGVGVIESTPLFPKSRYRLLVYVRHLGKFASFKAPGI